METANSLQHAHGPFCHILLIKKVICPDSEGGDGDKMVAESHHGRVGTMMFLGMATT